MQFCISDSGLPEQPQPDVEEIRILFNDQCITVPCAYQDEAETDLTVGTPEEVGQARTPQFDDWLPTASRLLVFTDVELNELANWPVASSETRIRIWTDALTLPERIVVAIG